jgi:hypothetical protein
MRPLGGNQKSILRSLVYDYMPGSSDRPYPGGGWVWDNHSTTVRLLESLVRRGLVMKDNCDQYRLTAEGRDVVTPDWAKK